jgi:hypothetical protein
MRGFSNGHREVKQKMMFGHDAPEVLALIDSQTRQRRIILQEPVRGGDEALRVPNIILVPFDVVIDLHKRTHGQSPKSIPLLACRRPLLHDPVHYSRQVATLRGAHAGQRRILGMWSPNVHEVLQCERRWAMGEAHGAKQVLHLAP